LVAPKPPRVREDDGVPVATLRRHYAKYERTAEDDATELAKLRTPRTEKIELDRKIRDDLSHDLSHGEAGDEESVDPSEGKGMEQKGFELVRAVISKGFLGFIVLLRPT
jgi:hypothetical protein